LYAGELTLTQFMLIACKKWAEHDIGRSSCFSCQTQRPVHVYSMY